MGLYFGATMPPPWRLSDMDLGPHAFVTGIWGIGKKRAQLWLIYNVR